MKVKCNEVIWTDVKEFRENALLILFCVCYLPENRTLYKLLYENHANNLFDVSDDHKELSKNANKIYFNHHLNAFDCSS